MFYININDDSSTLVYDGDTLMFHRNINDDSSTLVYDGDT